MKRFTLLLTVGIIGLILISGVAFAAAPFFEGKTIRIIVGYSAGGGYDLYARVLSRHMGRHIPGNPSIIVENMAGAGSLISANTLYKVAKPDGLTIGHFNGGLFFNQVLGQPGIEFDARKFKFIGAAGEGRFRCRMHENQRHHEPGQMDRIEDAREAGRDRSRCLHTG